MGATAVEGWAETAAAKGTRRWRRRRDGRDGREERPPSDAPPEAVGAAVEDTTGQK